MSISAAICIYNDFDFIEDCIARVYDVVDEIVILDGPYTYCEPILKEFDLHYDGIPDALKRIISLEKVKYVYKIFENEKSKRIALYEMCMSDIIMLLDSDELVTDVDLNAISEFRSSSQKVASARLNNHVRSATLLHKDTRKFIFFKRDMITAHEHLNYTWLIGVEQGEPDRSAMFRKPLMDIAHLTLMRSPYFNIVKYCFYTRLYFYSRGMVADLSTLFGIPFSELPLSGLSYAQMKEIFRRSIPALINFTEEAPLQSPNETLDSKYDDVVDVTPISESHEVFLLGGVDSYHYLNLPPHLVAEDVVHFSCVAKNIGSLAVEIIIHNGKECKRINCDVAIQEDNVVSGRFVAPFAMDKLFGALVHFKANSAQPRQVGRLTRFIIKKHAAIYGNCQTESLRDFLCSSKEFSRRFVFEETPGRLAHMMTPDDVRSLRIIMRRVDYLLTQPINKGFRGDDIFSTESILASAREDARVFMMPNLFFTGYAPDSYCVTYRKKFLQAPMPIHDINMIYSFIKHRGDRNATKSDYLGKLKDGDFYKKSFLINNVQKNIDELTRRETAARASYPGSNVHHFAYSTFLTDHYDKALTHYSDAHPTEYVFADIARTVLKDLDISDDLVPPVLGEKGVVPFYNSVGERLGFDAASQTIMVNNRAVSFDEFFKLYCDQYDKIETDELFGYIAKTVVRVIITNHKTGTMLMANIIRQYCNMFKLRLLELNHHLVRNGDQIDPSEDFQSYDFIFVTHAQHFEQLVTAVPYLRYRAVHLIRNPFEIIMSGVRYHQITDEAWCNKKLFVKAADGICGFKQIVTRYNVGPDEEIGDYAYRDIMNALSPREKIEFEMRNHASAFGTIPSISRFLRRFGPDANISTIRLEDIGSPQCISHVFNFLALQEDFLPVYKDRVGGKEWLGRHVTNREGGSTYMAAFDPALFDLFSSEFGSGTLQEFGYAPDSPPASYMQIGKEESPPIGDDQVDAVTFAAQTVKERDEVDPTADTFFQEGNRLLLGGEVQRSKESFLRSLKLAPREAGTLGRLGDVCVRLGQYQEAIEFYKQIEDLPITKPAWLYIGLANAYEALTQKEAAASNLRKALAVGDKLEILTSRLAALEQV